MDNKKGQVVSYYQHLVADYEEAEKTGQNIESQVASNRNFDVVADDGRTIFLVKKDGAGRFDLSTLLPDNIKIGFRQGERFEHSHEEAEVAYAASQIGNVGAVLNLLHEIGHIYQTTQNRKFHIFDVIRWMNKNLWEKMVKSNKYHVEGLLPSWFDEQKYNAGVKHERGAWAFALKSARMLESMGYNVLQEFESNRQVQDYINYRLHISEQGRQRKLMEQSPATSV